MRSPLPLPFPHFSTLLSARKGHAHAITDTHTHTHTHTHTLNVMSGSGSCHFICSTDQASAADLEQHLKTLQARTPQRRMDDSDDHLSSSFGLSTGFGSLGPVMQWASMPDPLPPVRVGRSVGRFVCWEVIQCTRVHIPGVRYHGLTFTFVFTLASR